MNYNIIIISFMMMMICVYMIYFLYKHYKENLKKQILKEEKCTCKELEKNHKICPVCDEEDYKSLHEIAEHLKDRELFPEKTKRAKEYITKLNDK